MKVELEKYAIRSCVIRHTVRNDYAGSEFGRFQIDREHRKELANKSAVIVNSFIRRMKWSANK